MSSFTFTLYLDGEPVSLTHHTSDPYPVPVKGTRTVTDGSRKVVTEVRNHYTLAPTEPEIPSPSHTHEANLAWVSYCKSSQPNPDQIVASYKAFHVGWAMASNQPTPELLGADALKRLPRGSLVLLEDAIYPYLKTRYGWRSVTDSLGDEHLTSTEVAPARLLWRP